MRADLDPEQFAFEMYGIMLGAHTFSRFLREPDALDRTRRAFERLLASYRPAGSPHPLISATTSGGSS